MLHECGVLQITSRMKFLGVKKWCTCSASDNLTPPISRVLIGRHLHFCSLTSPTYCNSSRKCTPVKYKARQKAGFPIVTETPSVVYIFFLTPNRNMFAGKFVKLESFLAVLREHIIFHVK